MSAGPTWRFAARAALVVCSAAVVQVAVLSPLTIAGVRPLALLLVAAAAGAALTPERAAAVGFAAGLVLDLLLTTPLGLCAGVFAVAANLAARVPVVHRPPPWWRVPALVAGTSVAAYGAVLLAGSVLLRRPLLPERPVAVLAVVAIVHGLLAIPAVWALRWAGGVAEPTIVVGAGRGQ